MVFGNRKDVVMNVVIGVAAVVGLLVCAFASALAGGSFLWGLVFGPLGVLVSAVVGQAEKTRKHIEIADRKSVV